MQMWSRGDGGDPRPGRRTCQRERLLEIARAIIDGGQHVGVDVDIAGDALILTSLRWLHHFRPDRTIGALTNRAEGHVTVTTRSCPMCGSTDSRPSWVGSTIFDGTEFRYFDCARCGSAFMWPTPSERTLEIMYSSEFLGDSPVPRPVVDDGTSAPAVVEELTKLSPGTFVDYGCGDGRLMIAASKLGWRSIGVEYGEDIAQEARRRSGEEVVTLSEVDRFIGQADVLHLGDVIEHMSDPAEELGAALRLLRPGGTLMAQGPLEANTSLFTWCMKTARNLRGRPPKETTPYHLVLATAHGQRELFHRLGLNQSTWEVRETAWPAPFSLSEVTNTRTAVLFAVRRVSRAITRIGPTDWGNRYWYIGRVAD